MISVSSTGSTPTTWATDSTKLDEATKASAQTVLNNDPNFKKAEEGFLKQIQEGAFTFNNLLEATIFEESDKHWGLTEENNPTRVKGGGVTTYRASLMEQGSTISKRQLTIAAPPSGNSTFAGNPSSSAPATQTVEVTTTSTPKEGVDGTVTLQKSETTKLVS
jgi:hypothetical protein